MRDTPPPTSRAIIVSVLFCQEARSFPSVMSLITYSEGYARRDPMFEFELDRLLLPFALATPALEPLFQLPPTFREHQPEFDQIRLERTVGPDLGLTLEAETMLGIRIYRDPICKCLGECTVKRHHTSEKLRPGYEQTASGLRHNHRRRL